MTLYFFFGWKESKWEAKIELCLKCDLHLKHWCSFLFSWTHWTCSINWVFLENCFSWKSFFLKIFNHKYYNWIFFSFMNSSNMSTKVFVWCRSETTIDTFWWFLLPSWTEEKWCFKSFFTSITLDGLFSLHHELILYAISNWNYYQILTHKFHKQRLLLICAFLRSPFVQSKHCKIHICKVLFPHEELLGVPSFSL